MDRVTPHGSATTAIATYHGHKGELPDNVDDPRKLLAQVVPPDLADLVLPVEGHSRIWWRRHGG